MLPANHLLTAHKRRISGSQVKGILARKKKKKKALKVLLLIGGVAAVTERLKVLPPVCASCARKADAPLDKRRLSPKDHFTEAFPFNYRIVASLY